MTAAEFKVLCPEFTGTANGTVEAAITQAEARTDATVYGSLYNEALKWTVADILASGIQGRQARTQKGDGPTIYRQKLVELINLVGAGHGSIYGV